MHAPIPDGSAVTFWADPTRTAQELRDRSPEDADGVRPVRQEGPGDRELPRVRVGGDAARPEVAVAGRRDHGPEARPRVPRPRRADRPGGDPRAPDGGGRPGAGGVHVGGGSRAARDARRAVHGDGRLGDRHRGGVPQRLGGHRRRRGRHGRVPRRGHRRTSRRVGAGRHRARRPGANRRRGGADPEPRHARDRRHPRRRHRAQRAADRLGCRPQAHRGPLRPGDARAHDGVARGQHPPAGRDRAGEPRVVGTAGVPRRRRRAARRPDRARSVDRRRGAGDGRGEVRARERGAGARGDDPVAHRSVARARGQARDERRVPGRALRAPRRRLGERARPGRRHRDQGARGAWLPGSANSSRRGK